MSLPLTCTVELAEMNCGECGGTYAINERYRKQKHENGGFWNCPYCQTSWGFGTSENDRLKEQIEKEKTRRKWAEKNANDWRNRSDTAERRRVAQKAATTRLKNRVKAGICPCCNRHFKQLAAHMKNKHPDYVKEKKED